MLILWSLDRNDLAAARQYYAERGKITADELRVLAMLQDDGSKLLDIAEREQWAIVSRRED